MMDPQNNSTQWVLVIGGSSGLGLATAKKFAKGGYHVCIIHRDRRTEMSSIDKHFDEIRSYGNNLLTFNIDAGNEEKQTAFIHAIKNENIDDIKFNVLVFSLAKGNLKPMVSADGNVLEVSDFKITIDYMAICLYAWVKNLFQHNLFAKNASIISYTSEGNQRAWPNYAAVSAAKAALEAITRNIALEFATFGLRANCIQAGITDTPSLRMIPGYEDLIKHAIQRNPSHRLTMPEDVADAAYLLCRSEAHWINGAVIPVDGGERIA